jgi:hypothetical protein
MPKRTQAEMIVHSMTPEQRRQFVLVYAYLPAVVQDPLGDPGWVPSWVRAEAPFQVVRPEGWYLVAKLRRRHIRVLKFLAHKYKHVKMRQAPDDTMEHCIVERGIFRARRGREAFEHALFAVAEMLRPHRGT